MSPCLCVARTFEARDLRSDRSTLSDAAAQEIAGRILRGELDSGERLPTEKELCDLLGVSRSVVRDAVRTLVARGLVQVRQGVGTVVTTPDDTAFAQALMALLMRSDLTVGDVLEARSAAETQIAAIAAERGNEKDWSALEADLNAFSEGVAKADWQTAHDRHLEFHLGIVRAVHLPALELMLMPMQQFILVSSLPPRRPDDPSAWEAPHPPILEALRAGDAGAAREAMQRHFEYMETRKFRATRFRELAELETMAGVSTRPGAVRQPAAAR
jgi:GntR family transcriptional regulator, transcriptional repressor for pyruvate dehydrogenase complex